MKNSITAVRPEVHMKNSITAVRPEVHMKIYKFTAEWCGPCKAMRPVLRKFAQSHPECIIEEVDLDKTAGYQLSEDYGVRAIPTLVWVDDKGKEMERVQGSSDLDSLVYAHGKALAKLAKKAKRSKKAVRK